MPGVMDWIPAAMAGNDKESFLIRSTLDITIASIQRCLCLSASYPMMFECMALLGLCIPGVMKCVFAAMLVKGESNLADRIHSHDCYGSNGSSRQMFGHACKLSNDAESMTSAWPPCARRNGIRSVGNCGRG